MNTLEIYGIYGIIYFCITIPIILLCYKVIGMRLKLFFLKGRGYGLVAEVQQSRGLELHTAKFSGRNLKLKDSRYYDVHSKDYLINDAFGCRALVVFENLKSSVNPLAASFQTLDSETLHGLIMRAIVEGKNSFFKFIESLKAYGPIGLIVVAIYMILTVFLLWRIMQSGGGAVL